VAKSVEQSYNGDYEYFAYAATEDGLDAFLKHETRLLEITEPAAPSRLSATKKPSSGFDDMDADIPF
jgi:hypothetical protein